MPSGSADCFASKKIEFLFVALKKMLPCIPICLVGQTPYHKDENFQNRNGGVNLTL